MTISEPLETDAALEPRPSNDEPDEDGAPPERLPALLEALLFVADGPVNALTLARVFGVRQREIEAPLDELAESLQGRGLRLQRGPEGIQLVTAPFASSYVEQFLGLESAKRLSTAALETLAIVAYRQPVTRAQVEAIRGVNSDAAIDTLRTRGLVDIMGRAEGPGRPALFATTQRFLEHFGLERPEDLPPLPEEIAGVAAARLMESGAQLPLPTIVPAGPMTVVAQIATHHGGERFTTNADEVATRAPAGAGPHLPGSGVALPGGATRPGSASGFGGPPHVPGSSPPGRVGPGGPPAGMAGPPRGPGLPAPGAPRFG